MGCFRWINRIIGMGIGEMYSVHLIFSAGGFYFYFGFGLIYELWRLDIYVTAESTFVIFLSQLSSGELNKICIAEMKKWSKGLWGWAKNWNNFSDLCMQHMSNQSFHPFLVSLLCPASEHFFHNLGCTFMVWTMPDVIVPRPVFTLPDYLTNNCY